MEVDGIDRRIGYVDVCSLYPTAMYFDDYPVGHPIIFKNPRAFDPTWFGFIKCKVAPPRSLYHPVLPVKVKTGSSEKLVFPLCLTCAVESVNTHRCNHTDAEREIIGTWGTKEVEKAVEMGYKILEIYEVMHFEKSNSLFKGYVQDFMKIKLETSPHTYPSNETYAAEVKKAYGINLDLNNIAPNPGKRAVSKLCLNSLWGKFGQRQNMGSTEYVTDPARFYELLLDDKLTDMNVEILTDEMVQVNYKHKDMFVEDTYNTNIYVAAYTTINARLRLYAMLEKLGTAVLYCDTDSVIYIDDGKNTVKTGDLLGEWTDELGEGVYIKKFLTTGPKSYYYITNTGKECIKVKGFTLHYTNAAKITGEVMEKLIDGEIENVVTSGSNITRDVTTKQLVNKEQTKKFSFSFDKRAICLDFDTLPFGY